MPLEYRQFITRQMLKDEPQTLFVFGDNMMGLGYGGQAAEMRGEPNAVGIPTKHSPATTAKAFFDDSDECFNQVLYTINYRFGILADYLKRGGKVVFPEAGIGTGLADLELKAPRIWALIQALHQQLTEIK